MSAKTRCAPSMQRSLSFSEAIDSFILYLAVERGLSENYELLNRRLLHKLSVWCQTQGILDPKKVHPDHLTDYLYQLRKRGLVAASLKQEMAAMKGFYRFLKSRYGLQRDPAELLRTPKVKSPLPRTLNQLEMNRLLAVELSQHRRLFKTKDSPYWHCQFRTPDGRMVRHSTRETDEAKAWEVSKGLVYSEANHSGNVISGHFREQDFQRRYPRRDRAMLEVLYGCGLRATELATVQLANVNLEERTMRVVGKGSKTRLVPIGSKACAAIDNYVKCERQWLTAATRTGRPAKARAELFLSERRGGPLTYQRIWQLITELSALAGFSESIYPHLFRHSFATHLLENDCDLRVIQELLGHENITTTAGYTHLDIRNLKEVHKRYHPRSGAPKEPQTVLTPLAAA
jgi:site-specific recombinase XerD